ncbi:ABC transporter ATP-binding protein [Qingshengfaniella alkalisoli]|uniref:ATP-binding cassette domain-containing protein n=1 Tax=Qingshengfaniella alkalisoli TaxID=2599296 RepID=A0A5B8J4S6_9RHOB|nr:ATP-binding cassette domain-containing protein [Qingshengfaniella alkalisoli]QDY71698.1 ATP-binding cassette domain-containing protein [Qingshengfaniella alkalisoli]
MRDAGLPLDVCDLVLTGDRGRDIVTIPRLTVAAGEAVGLRGASGAGKSSLLFVLAGLTSRMQGGVLWGETDIVSLPPDARAAFRADHMGIVFQDFLLFEEMDARGNAAVQAMFRTRAQRAALREGAERELAALGLSDTGRRVDSFSGGERQRVAVARALAAKPRVILADEPTANLDRATGDRLIEDLLRLRDGSGQTIIVVSHDERLLRRMDRVLVMEGGRIV